MATAQRSPKYPFISLEKAIERCRQLYRAEGRNKAAVPVAVKAWGYSPNSSGAQQTIAALIGYGLLADEGSGGTRSIKLSDLAIRIILDERPDSLERERFIREAALRPRIFLELTERWKDTGLPSHANFIHTLIFEYKFPDKNAADAFYKVFSQTASFSGIFNSDINSIAENDISDSNNYSESEESSVELANENIPTASQQKFSSNIKQDTFSLDEGQVVVQWPSNLSKESLEDLMDYFELLKRKIRRSVEQSNVTD